MDESIGFIVTDRVVDNEQPENQSNERNDPQEQINIPGVFFLNENMNKNGAKRKENISFERDFLIQCNCLLGKINGAPAQTRTALFGSGGRHSVH